MTVRDIIRELRNLGYEVEFYNRIDKSGRLRGVRISAINGRRFTGSAGNITARELLDIQLSDARANQLQAIRKPRVEPLPQQIQRKLRRVQRMASKERKVSKEPEKIPRISTKNVREHLKRHGYEETMESLDNAERRIKKLVPTWLWDELIEKIKINNAYFSESQYKDLWREYHDKMVMLDINRVKYYDHYEPLLSLFYNIENGARDGAWDDVKDALEFSIAVIDSI